MNPEMLTTLLNTYTPKLIATILKTLREHLKENDRLNAVEQIAGPVPEIPLEYDQILKGRRRIPGTMSTEDICQKISFWLPDVKRLNGYIVKVSTKLSRCKSAEMQV